MVKLGNGTQRGFCLISFLCVYTQSEGEGLRREEVRRTIEVTMIKSIISLLIHVVLFTTVLLALSITNVYFDPYAGGRDIDIDQYFPIRHQEPLLTVDVTYLRCLSIVFSLHCSHMLISSPSSCWCIIFSSLSMRCTP